MFEYALGCLTVGAVWFFWPRISAWLPGEKAKIIQDVTSAEDKIKERL